MVDDDLSSNDASEEDTTYSTPTLVRYWAPPGTTNPKAALSETTKVAVTEKEKHTVSIYQKVLGSNRPARYEDDVEARAGQMVSQPTQRSLSEDKPKLLEIMHNWTEQVQDDGEFVANINVVPRDAPTSAQERVYVGWVHVEDDTPSLVKLKDILTDAVSTRIPLDVHDVATSLLQKVRVTRQKKYALGKYMTPGAIRYDVTDKFFDVSKMNRNADMHPVRSLMQSRYHLQSTRYRDNKQSILSLAYQDIADCIQLPNDSLGRINTSSRWNSRVYVPHLWALSVSGDIMVTNGPISEANLRGSILTRESLKLDTNSVSPIIRFEVEDVTNKVEKFLYPVDRCDWYYGLLNKKRKILANLGQKKSRHQKRFGASADFHEFRLYTNVLDEEILITDDNWIDILHSQAQMREQPYEQLVVTVRRHTKVPDIIVPTSSGKPSSDADSSVHLRPPSVNPKKSSSSAPPSITSQTTVPQLADFISFFAWPFLQERSVDTQHSDQDRILRWLDRLAKTVIGVYKPDLDESFHVVQHNAIATAIPISVLIEPPISGISHERLRTEVFPSFSDPQDGSGTNTVNLPPELKLGERCQSAVRLLRFFVPRRTAIADPDPVHEHPFVLMYWGVFRRILNDIIAGKFSTGELDLMLSYVDDICLAAESLHKGVRKLKVQHERSKSQSHNLTPDLNSWVNDESANIQSPIPTALEHVVNMFFAIVRFTIKATTARDIKAFKTAVDPHYKKAMKALENAKDLLIVAADENASQKSLGPVVTPEAIILLLIERLTKGVYQNGNIDMTDVYGRIVEQLASKVERHPSRYLLLEINQVCEEVDIIIDVLAQQYRCLEDLKAYLDPKTFDKPSTKRRIRFEFEKFAIERILEAIDEQIDGFQELRERGRTLTDQNVKLVESSLDDNNRVITLFTLVTITVLPFSAVTGFFGMNVVGVSGTSYTVKHFWLVASICTGVSILVAILVINYWAEAKRALVNWWASKPPQHLRE